MIPKVKDPSVNEFIDIPGCPGYKASRDGRIMGKAGIIMKQSFKGHGKYLGVDIRKNGKSTGGTTHRLIAITFVPNPNNYPEVDHIDHNKLNNRADNLEWVTRDENMKRAVNAGRIRNGDNHCNSKVTADLVRRVRQMKKDNAYLSNNAMAKIFNIHSSQASRIISGKYWKHVL